MTAVSPPPSGTSAIQHFLEDSFKPGRYMLADKGSIWSISNISADTPTLVAGSSNQFGFLDASFGEARFASIRDFVQIHTDVLVVVDHENDCLRRVVISKGRVSTLAGLCGEPGTADGEQSSRLNRPNSVAMKSKKLLYITESRSFKIRVVARNLGDIWSVQTTAVDLPSTPTYVGFDTSKIYLYVTTSSGSLYKINPTLEKKEQVFKTNGGYGDGTFGQAKFQRLNKFIALSDSVLLVCDERNLRVIDLELGKISSICDQQQKSRFLEGNISTCTMPRPRAIAKRKSSVLIGLKSQIVSLSYSGE